MLKTLCAAYQGAGAFSSVLASIDQGEEFRPSNAAVAAGFLEKMKTPVDDWRKQGQERFLRGVVLVHRLYRQREQNPRWDHDHCEFCGATFSLLDKPEYLKEGYATEDDYYWMCQTCFDDFKDEFQWQVREKME